MNMQMTHMSHKIDFWWLNSVKGDVPDSVANHSLVFLTTVRASLRVILALFLPSVNGSAYFFRSSAVPGASTTSPLSMICWTTLM